MNYCPFDGATRLTSSKRCFIYAGATAVAALSIWLCDRTWRDASGRSTAGRPGTTASAASTATGDCPLVQDDSSTAVENGGLDHSYGGASVDDEPWVQGSFGMGKQAGAASTSTGCPKSPNRPRRALGHLLHHISETRAAQAALAATTPE